jgi:hypothetical protein
MNRTNKIKKLSKKLGIRDAGLLDLALSDTAKEIIFSDEQIERLKKIKKEITC